MWDLYPAPVFGHVMPSLSLVVSPVSLCPEASLVSSKTLKILDPADVLGVWVLQPEKSELGATQKLWGRGKGSEKREVYLWLYFLLNKVLNFGGETREIWPTVKNKKNNKQDKIIPILWCHLLTYCHTEISWFKYECIIFHSLCIFSYLWWNKLFKL